MNLVLSPKPGEETPEGRKSVRTDLRGAMGQLHVEAAAHLQFCASLMESTIPNWQVKQRPSWDSFRRMPKSEQIKAIKEMPMGTLLMVKEVVAKGGMDQDWLDQCISLLTRGLEDLKDEPFAQIVILAANSYVSIQRSASLLRKVVDTMDAVVENSCNAISSERDQFAMDLEAEVSRLDVALKENASLKLQLAKLAGDKERVPFDLVATLREDIATYKTRASEARVVALHSDRIRSAAEKEQGVLMGIIQELRAQLAQPANRPLFIDFSPQPAKPQRRSEEEERPPPAANTEVPRSSVSLASMGREASPVPSLFGEGVQVQTAEEFERLRKFEFDDREGPATAYNFWDKYFPGVPLRSGASCCATVYS